MSGLLAENAVPFQFIELLAIAEFILGRLVPYRGFSSHLVFPRNHKSNKSPNNPALGALGRR
jgi:hypothetical protein